MSELQDYNSRLSDPNSRKFETLSYLPPLTDEQVRAEVEYIVAKGWNPAIEHTEPENATGSYWYMWKLPMFGETDVDAILNSPWGADLLSDEYRVGHILLTAEEGAPDEVVALMGASFVSFGIAERRYSSRYAAV